MERAPRPMAIVPDWTSSLMPNGSSILSMASSLSLLPVASMVTASGRDVHGLGAEQLDDLDDLGAGLVVGADLHQDEFALDGRRRLQLDDLQHVDELVELLGDLLQRQVLDVDHDGDAGDVGVLGDADGERVDVEAAAGEQRGDPGEDAGLVLHQDGERVLGHVSSVLFSTCVLGSVVFVVAEVGADVPGGHDLVVGGAGGDHRPDHGVLVDDEVDTTGRSLMALASAMTLSSSSGSSQRMRDAAHGLGQLDEVGDAGAARWARAAVGAVLGAACAARCWSSAGCRRGSATGGPCPSAPLLMMATLIGMLFSAQVASSWLVIWKQPSPSIAQTVRSGVPALAPIAAGTA